ncbi:hypothetical protein [Granulicella arctica]|uniref:hypothetical protein n=1 Tax=Granulicella arctica TaxID=940613 RepID=UPI0021DF6176|nr:hypothetical protein [Granulicella arctica]
MKNIIRAFVIALTVTGAVASANTINIPNATTSVTKPKPSSLPIPMCPPNDPNACGIAK